MPFLGLILNQGTLPGTVQLLRSKGTVFPLKHHTKGSNGGWLTFLLPVDTSFHPNLLFFMGSGLSFLSVVQDPTLNTQKIISTNHVKCMGKEMNSIPHHRKHPTLRLSSRKLETAC